MNLAARKELPNPFDRVPDLPTSPCILRTLVKLQCAAKVIREFIVNQPPKKPPYLLDEPPPGRPRRSCMPRWIEGRNLGPSQPACPGPHLIFHSRRQQETWPMELDPPGPGSEPFCSRKSGTTAYVDPPQTQNGAPMLPIGWRAGLPLATPKHLRARAIGRLVRPLKSHAGGLSDGQL